MSGGHSPAYRAGETPALHQYRFARLLKWARLAIQMIFKFFSELFHERHGGHRCRVSERTECLSQHVLSQVIDVVDVLLQPSTRMEARERLLQPVGAFTAGDAPAATFMLIKLDGAQRELHNAGRIIEHNHPAGP